MLPDRSSICSQKLRCNAWTRSSASGLWGGIVFCLRPPTGAAGRGRSSGYYEQFLVQLARITQILIAPDGIAIIGP